MEKYVLQLCGQARGGDFWQPPHAFQYAILELAPPLRLFVALRRQRNPRRQDACRPESGIDTQDTVEALHQQAGAHEQDKCERDLCDREHTKRRARAPVFGSRGTFARPTQTIGYVFMREPNSRRQPEEHAAKQSQKDREQ